MNVKVPTSDSYYDPLILSLKDPEQAAAYLEAILAEDNPEPELHRALSNIAEALGQETLNQHSDQLNDLLSQSGSNVIYQLEDWLKGLGLKLTITVNDIDERSH
ncbi:helix-turn-helix domain-containing transcriptional regulator [Phormidesmis priestleyi]